VNRAPGRPKRRHHVLCIDDNEDGVAVRRSILEHWGYYAMTAPDGDAGLRAMEAHVFDLLIVDYSLPGKNGEEIARVVRQRWPEVRIVMLSGHSDIPDSAMQTIDAFLGKGEPGAHLQSLLAHLLGSVQSTIVKPAERSTCKLTRKAVVSVKRNPRLRISGRGVSG